MIEIDEDRQILMKQRRKRRTGSMLEVDKKLAAVKQRKAKRVQKNLKTENL